MRITRDTLLKVAQDATKRQARSRPSLLAAYLTGSLLGEDFLLGGSTDVDLVFVYSMADIAGREIVRMTEDIHLDILHHDQKEYRDTRKLRVHPWMGPTLNNCKVLYDPQHFMDFTQASVRGQFDRPDHVLERARLLADQARQIWFGFGLEEIDAGPAEVNRYLEALELSANAIAMLSGGPLADRRFLLKFRERADAVGRPGLYAGLAGLLGAPSLPPQALDDWLLPWRETYQLACQSLPGEDSTRLHPDRLHYYSGVFQAWLNTPQSEAILWPLLRTWTLAASHCPSDAPELNSWRRALTILGLAGQSFPGKIEALDAYLDLIDETLETWARANGAWQT